MMNYHYELINLPHDWFSLPPCGLFHWKWNRATSCHESKRFACPPGKCHSWNNKWLDWRVNWPGMRERLERKNQWLVSVSLASQVMVQFADWWMFTHHCHVMKDDENGGKHLVIFGIIRWDHVVICGPNDHIQELYGTPIDKEERHNETQHLGHFTPTIELLWRCRIVTGPPVAWECAADAYVKIGDGQPRNEICRQEYERRVEIGRLMIGPTFNAIIIVYGRVIGPRGHGRKIGLRSIVHHSPGQWWEIVHGHPGFDGLQCDRVQLNGANCHAPHPNGGQQLGVMKCGRISFKWMTNQIISMINNNPINDYSLDSIHEMMTTTIMEAFWLIDYLSSEMISNVLMETKTDIVMANWKT